MNTYKHTHTHTHTTTHISADDWGLNEFPEIAQDRQCARRALHGGGEGGRQVEGTEGGGCLTYACAAVQRDAKPEVGRRTEGASHGIRRARRTIVPLRAHLALSLPCQRLECALPTRSACFCSRLREHSTGSTGCALLRALLVRIRPLRARCAFLRPLHRTSCKAQPDVCIFHKIVNLVGDFHALCKFTYDFRRLSALWAGAALCVGKSALEITKAACRTRPT